MEINVAQSGLQNMFALINNTSGTSLTSSDITIGTPSVLDTTNTASSHNTQVTLTAAEDGDYLGSQTIHYTRLDLDTLRDAKTLAFTKTQSSTLADIKSAIVAQLGVVPNQVALDVDTMPTVPEDQDSVTINLVPITDAYLYIGTTAITIFPPKTQMSEAVSNTEMNGFDYPDQGDSAS